MTGDLETFTSPPRMEYATKGHSDLSVKVQWIFAWESYCDLKEGIYIKGHVKKHVLWPT